MCICMPVVSTTIVWKCLLNFLNWSSAIDYVSHMIYNSLLYLFFSDNCKQLHIVTLQLNIDTQI